MNCRRHLLKRRSKLKKDLLNAVIMLGSSLKSLFSVLKIQRANLIFSLLDAKRKTRGQKRRKFITFSTLDW